MIVIKDVMHLPSWRKFLMLIFCMMISWSWVILMMNCLITCWLFPL